MRAWRGTRSISGCCCLCIALNVLRRYTRLRQGVPSWAIRELRYGVPSWAIRGTELGQRVPTEYMSIENQARLKGT
eukprot:2161855-Rhodomonas_salina.2